jgi:uncharacterized membrane protein YfcA
MSYLVIVLASLIAGTLDTVAGFGGSLLLIPVLALKIGSKDAVLLSALIPLGWNLTRLVMLRQFANWRASWQFALGILPGAIIGASLLDRVDPNALSVAIGITLILFGGYYVLRLYVDLPQPRGLKSWAFPLFGLASGIASAILGAGNGPIQTWGMASAGLAPREIAVTGGALGAITAISRLIGYALSDQLDAGMWLPGLVGIVAAALGSLYGVRLSLRAKDSTLELVIGIVIMLAGVRMLL